MMGPWIYVLSLLILGFALVLLEIFVIPGFNIFGVIGFFTIVTGVGYAYFAMGFWAAAWATALGLTGTTALVWLLFRARAWRRLILDNVLSRGAGYSSSSPDSEALIGQRGETLTVLRPAGRMRLGDRLLDVVSQGEFIGRGEQVEITQVHGNRIVVHPAVDDSA